MWEIEKHKQNAFQMDISNNPNLLSPWSGADNLVSSGCLVKLSQLVVSFEKRIGALVGF